MLIRVFELDKKEELIVEFEATSVPAIGDVVSIGEDEEVRIVSKATWGVDRVVGTDLTLANLIMVDVYAVPTQYDATPDVEAVKLRKELADAKAEVERLRGRAESAISIVLGVAAKLVTTAPADGDMPLRNDDLHSRLAGHALTLKGACQVLRGKTDADLAAKERET